MNLVLLHLNENPEVHIDESIAYVEEIVGMKWKEFLKHVLMDGSDDMPKPCKNIHLSCLKAFQMFFNSSNLFDSKTALVDDIKKAIYLPIDRTPKPFLKPLPSPVPAKKENVTKISASFDGALTNRGNTTPLLMLFKQMQLSDFNTETQLERNSSVFPPPPAHLNKIRLFPISHFPSKKSKRISPPPETDVSTVGILKGV
ncbi:S-linalool synthase [Forsythia ovata]|uniref:S-linalool synthase n=1 Tax=Forsythia ovata TaxID=205694 RepID=A0ABD1S6V9_9LAMI